MSIKEHLDLSTAGLKACGRVTYGQETLNNEVFRVANTNQLQMDVVIGNWWIGDMLRLRHMILMNRILYDR